MEVDRHKILFGGKLGTGTADAEDEEMKPSIAKTVKHGHRVKIVPDFVDNGVLNDCIHSRSIPRMRFGPSVLWTLNLVMPTLNLIVSYAHILPFPGLKLLGFKNKSEIAFEDNVKHALFIYPDELVNDSLLGASSPV